MSLCDKCFSPGQCCKNIQLHTAGGSLTFWDSDSQQTIKNYLKEKENLPFLPVKKNGTHIDPKTGFTYSDWIYKCPHLQESGRCGDYDNRPDLCRRFKEGENQACVHFGGAEGTGEGL